MTGQPQIRFGGTRQGAREVLLKLDEKKNLVVDVGPEVTEEPSVRRTEGVFEPVDYLTNLLWLSRRCPLRRAVTLLREPPGAVKVVLVPRRKKKQWRSQVEAIEPLDQERKVVEVENETAFRIHRRLPPARITTDDPERPGCCRYRDFSRGITEVAWTDPQPPEVGRLTVVTADREFFFAPSATSTRRGQHAVKVDYGFLCQMSGARRPIDVHYAGVEDVG